MSSKVYADGNPSPYTGRLAAEVLRLIPDPVGDLRTPRDYRYYNVNGNAVIHVGDVHEAIKRLAPPDFHDKLVFVSRLFADPSTSENDRAACREFLDASQSTMLSISERALAATMLVRILDREANKQRLPLETGGERLIYATQSVLLQLADGVGIDCKKFNHPAQCYNAARATFIGRLVPGVTDVAVNIRIAWNDRSPRLAEHRVQLDQAIYDRYELADWPEIPLRYACRAVAPVDGKPQPPQCNLPDSWQSLGAQMDRVLKRQYPALTRRATWGMLLQHFARTDGVREITGPEALQFDDFGPGVRVTVQRMGAEEALYDRIKDPMFRASRAVGRGRELRLRGSDDLVTRYVSELGRRISVAAREATTQKILPAGRDRWRQVVADLRSTTPFEIANALLAESNSITGSWRNVQAEATRPFDDAPIQDLDATTAAARDFLLDPSSEAIDVFPHYAQRLGGGEQRILFWTSREETDLGFLPIKHPRVAAQLREFARQEGMVPLVAPFLRRLFERNEMVIDPRVRGEIRTKQGDRELTQPALRWDPAWPLISVDPNQDRGLASRWARALRVDDRTAWASIFETILNLPNTE